MKDFGKIILYLVAVVILGALLAPPLYWGAHWLADQGIATFLTQYEFRKFFNRAALLSAVVLLWPVAKWINVPNVRELGIRPNPQRWKDLVVGFLGSFLILALYAGILIYMEIFRIRSEIRWGELWMAVPPAVIVSFLEEWLFRGAILGLLLRGLRHRPYIALFFVSTLFAIVHFLKPEKVVDVADVGWLSGFALIPSIFSKFENYQMILAGFITLFFIGWILGWTRLKTHSLWLAIGLHAGWIFGVKTLGPIARRKIKSDVTFPWLGDDLSVGICSAAMVLLTGLLIWIWVTYLRNKDDEPSLDTSKNR